MTPPDHEAAARELIRKIGHNPGWKHLEKEVVAFLAKHYPSPASVGSEEVDRAIAKCQPDEWGGYPESIEAGRLALEVVRLRRLLSAPSESEKALREELEAEKRALARSQACDKEHLDYAKKMVKERDEARAEVERLKADRDSIIGRHMADGAHFKCHGILALFKKANAALTAALSASEQREKALRADLANTQKDLNQTQDREIALREELAKVSDKNYCRHCGGRHIETAHMPSSCGVAGHFSFQANGGICTMCQAVRVVEKERDEARERVKVLTEALNHIADNPCSWEDVENTASKALAGKKI